MPAGTSSRLDISVEVDHGAGDEVDQDSDIFHDQHHHQERNPIPRNDVEPSESSVLRRVGTPEIDGRPRVHDVISSADCEEWEGHKHDAKELWADGLSL